MKVVNINRGLMRFLGPQVLNRRFRLHELVVQEHVALVQDSVCFLLLGDLSEEDRDVLGLQHFAARS